VRGALIVTNDHAGGNRSRDAGTRSRR
jgi:hypothetical protein